MGFKWERGQNCAESEMARWLAFCILLEVGFQLYSVRILRTGFGFEWKLQMLIGGKYEKSFFFLLLINMFF